MLFEKNATEEKVEELEIETVILEDEITGEVVKCDALDLIELEGKTYVVLLPEEENTVVILEIKKENGEEYYVSVEDDVLEEVYHLFEARKPEYFVDSES